MTGQIATRIPAARCGGGIRSELDDHGRSLVPLDPRIQRRRVVEGADVAEEVVEVGAAEADRLRSEEHLAGTGRVGRLDVDDLHHRSGPGDGCAHATHAEIESRREGQMQRRGQRIALLAQPSEAERGSRMREPVFTETMQVALVVRDIEATMRTYVHEYGIGPWAIYEFNPETVTEMDEGRRAGRVRLPARARRWSAAPSSS